MRAPTYTWVCHKCGASNQAHTETCASCGFQAVASEIEINPESEEERRQRRERNAAISSSVWLFFPEGLIAGVLALISPFWAIKLVLDGDYLAATGLAAIIAVCSYGFIWAVRRHQKYLAYVAILCFLLGAWFVDSSLTP